MTTQVDPPYEPGVERFGDMTRFLDSLRCNSCQQVDGRCIVAQGDERCMLCTGTSKTCQFKRTITRTLAIQHFTWQEMTNPSTCYEVYDSRTSRQPLDSYRASSSLSTEHLEHRQQERSQLRRSRDKFINQINSPDSYTRSSRKSTHKQLSLYCIFTGPSHGQL